MCKYTVVKALVLVNLLVFTGCRTAAYAEGESDRVKENIGTLQKTKACPGCDLSGAELNRMDLSEANLQGANLTDAKLYLVNFSGANLQKARLQRAHFGGADLTGADLRGADLQGADLNGAYLEGAKFDGEYVGSKPYDEEMSSESEKQTQVNESPQAHETAPVPKDEKKVSNRRRTAGEQREGQSVVRPVKTDEPIKDIVVSENLQPSMAAHRDTEKKEDPEQGTTKEMNGLAGSSTDRAQEKGIAKTDEETEANTSKAISPVIVASHDSDAAPVPAVDHEHSSPSAHDEKIESVAGGTIEGSSSENVSSGQVQPLVEKEVKIENQEDKEKNIKASALPPKEISGEKANNLKRLLDTKRCYQCDLSGVDLSDKNLGGADLEGANLTGSNLEKTDLGKAVLRGALLVDANLKKADLRGADLYRADLSRADLNEANMQDAKIDGTIFDGAIGR